MPHHPVNVVLVVAVAGALAGGALACGDRSPKSTSGSGATPTASSSTTGPGKPAAAPALAWNDSSAGSVLVVAGSNPTEAAVVFPHFNDSTLGAVTTLDTAAVNRAHVDLFNRSGPAGQAVLVLATAGTLTGDCTAWPTAHVRSLEQGSAGVPPAWTVGLQAGHATSIPMDSTPALSPVDSARRAAEIALVASTLPNDTAAAFRGLPFVVRSAGRLALDSGTSVIAAEVIRTVNEEANPREEHILLVSERDPVTGKPVAAYFERVSGPEDAVESSEILAAVRLGPRRVPTIVISRDYGDGGAYTLLERAAPARWRVRWNSAYTGC
ncbi:MAG TPA: hypothetical protein VNW46_19905 [Gemmatimonadaceae bacterium]|jgi:hypothetical protein|nr:hypothetical protein [Gemmatimonadaceae bacterium]